MEAGASQWAHVEQLPPYSPELNPDEAVWQHFKHMALANVSCPNFEVLGREVQLAVMRLWGKPQLIK